MSSLIALLARHGLAAFAGTLASQGIHADADSTASLFTALIIFGLASLWSWFSKLHRSTSSKTPDVIDDSTADMLRKMVGALVSQGVAGLSGYLATRGHAIDASDPVALSVFAANLALSKAGVHQGIAAIGSGKAALLVFLSACSVCSVGCSNLSVSQRQAITRTVVSLSQVGLSLAHSRGVVRDGDRVLIHDGLALIVEEDATTRDKLVRLSELGVQAAVDRGVIHDGDVILIREAAAIIESAVQPQTSAKQPVKVMPTEHAEQTESGGRDQASSGVPACLMTYPSGSDAEAASSGQSRACGLLNHAPLRGAPNCTACHAGSSAKHTTAILSCNGMASTPALVAR